MVVMPDMSAPLSISDPLLHDIIQSYITRHPTDILELMSKLPETKHSRLFLPTCMHRFVDARNEWFLSEGDIRIGRNKRSSIEHVYKYPKDVVYRFGLFDTKYEYEGKIFGTDDISYKFVSFCMIHEIKTGKYNISEEMYKHYIHSSHTQLLIWAYPYWHRRNPPPRGSYIKQMSINHLKPYINSEVGSILKLWVGDE